eukprot:1224180-Rhodomonas_salina.7
MEITTDDFSPCAMMGAATTVVGAPYWAPPAAVYPPAAPMLPAAPMPAPYWQVGPNAYQLPTVWSGDHVLSGGQAEWAAEDAAQHALNLANWRIKLLKVHNYPETSNKNPLVQSNLSRHCMVCVCGCAFAFAGSQIAATVSLCFSCACYPFTKTSTSDTSSADAHTVPLPPPFPPPPPPLLLLPFPHLLHPPPASVGEEEAGSAHGRGHGGRRPLV